MRALAFLLCLLPAALLLLRGLQGNLGPNPIEYITRATGDWTLRFLLITLAVTPVRKLLNKPGLIRYRRMLGLFAFFYGGLHLLTYLWLDQFFDWRGILNDVARRPFVTAGAAAFLAMVPLAATSTAGWIRRLGGKRWRALHRLVYFSAAAGVVHFYWLVKSDVREPLLYGFLLALLLGYRLVARARQGKVKPRLSSAGAGAPARD